MRVRRLRLRRAISAIISWVGSNELFPALSCEDWQIDTYPKIGGGSGWGNALLLPFVFFFFFFYLWCILSPKCLDIWQAVCLLHKLDLLKIPKICDLFFCKNLILHTKKSFLVWNVLLFIPSSVLKIESKYALWFNFYNFLNILICEFFAKYGP